MFTFTRRRSARRRNALLHRSSAPTAFRSLDLPRYDAELTASATRIQFR